MRDVDSRFVVDVHTHYMPKDLPQFSSRYGDKRWPHLTEQDDGSGAIWLGDQLFREVKRTCFNVSDRVADMDEYGIDFQAISPLPVALSYWAVPQLAMQFARLQNDALAEAASGSAGRLVALGTVPLQDPTLAIKELERIMVDLGMKGVEIGASVGNTGLDSPRFLPFFEAAEELGARIFIHPLEGGTQLVTCSSPVQAFGVGMLTDTALAGTALVFGGVLDRFPSLQICLAHGGGTLPWTYPRSKFRACVGLSGDAAVRFEKAADSRLRGIHVDSIVFDPMHLSLLLHHFGPEKVVLGSDYPMSTWEPPGESDILARAAALGACTAHQAAAIRGQSGASFLGLARSAD
jgi:aminocarboxymuconate-semialdehyde decarboxylase